MIFVSAGHHQDAKGASYSTFNEHDEALIWQSLILNRLGENGMGVPSGVLKSKTTFINSFASEKDIAIEVHFNSAKNGNGVHVGEGSETLYFPSSKRGKKVAKALQERLSTIFPPDRGAKEGWYRMDESRGPNFFLERTVCTAVIIEPEFIHRQSIIQDNRLHACEVIADTLLLQAGI